MSLLNKKLDVAIRYIFSLHMYKAKKKINERLNNQSHFVFHSNEWSKEGFAEEGVAGADHLSLSVTIRTLFLNKSVLVFSLHLTRKIFLCQKMFSP